MMIIDDYVKPKSLKEAFELLSSRKDASIIGGGAFLNVTSKKIGLGIDIFDLGLNFIKETSHFIEIGAMTTYRTIEKSVMLNNMFNGALVDAVKDVVGVQMKNVFTVGGTIGGKYGFSNLITVLLSLNAKVLFFNSGEFSLEKYINGEIGQNDIVEKIIIPKQNTSCSFQLLTNSVTDFAVLNVAVSKINNKFNIVVGARPAIANFAVKSMEFINNTELNDTAILKCAEIASEEISFSSDMRGSSEYRKELCKILVKKAIKEVINEN